MKLEGWCLAARTRVYAHAAFCVCLLLSFFFFPQQLKALGSQPIGSGVVLGGPEVSSTRVPPEFHQDSTRVPRGSARGAGWCEHMRALKRAPHAVGDIT